MSDQSTRKAKIRLGAGATAKQMAKERMLIQKEMSKRRACPICKKTFTWRETRDGQIYCSKRCAFSDPNRPCGRPSPMVEEVLEKLRYAFMVGSTDEEACQYADISTDNLYNYQKAHPEFKEEKEALKNRQVLKARVKVFSSIDSDIDTARWFLEKKRRKEFGNKVMLDGKLLTGEMSEEDKKRVQEIAESFGEDDDLGV